MAHNMRPSSMARLTLVMLALTSGSVAAQEFPSRPVRFVVPYAAGGSGDMLARLVGSKLSSMWGQQVVIDNRPGGGGLIGTEFAARAEPDGYTLYLATDGPLTIAASLYKRVPYDWKRDFAPVSMVAAGYQVLIVRPSLPARNVQEFVALARQRPGELNYASIGIGSAPTWVLNCSNPSPRSTLPTYPTEAPRRRRLPRCSQATCRCFWSALRPRPRTSRAERCVPLVSPQGTGSKAFPISPLRRGRAARHGYQHLVCRARPAGVPTGIIKKLTGDIAQVVADSEFQKTLAARGFEARSSSPEQLAEFLLKDYIKFRDLIGRLGLQVEQRRSE